MSFGHISTSETVMRPSSWLVAFFLLVGSIATIRADDPPAPPKVSIEVQADKPGHAISRLLSGVCLEDVNHEIYGGLYSQMLFGESFQEPELTTDQIKGFRALGGVWSVREGELNVTGTAGDKLVSDLPAFKDGEVGVEVYVPDGKLTNAGLIVRVDNARRSGADNFDGYEIALNAEKQTVLLGRHRQNFDSLKVAPCEVPTGQWVPLVIKLDGSSIEVRVNGKNVLKHDDGRASLPAGTVGLRQWQKDALYRNLYVKTAGKSHTLAFEALPGERPKVSGMWRAVQTDTARGSFSPTTERPFVGTRSQRITFLDGKGQVGVENQGLNRVGLWVADGKTYSGVLLARAEKSAELFVAMQNRDGSKSWAEERLQVKGDGEWHRLPFGLKASGGGAGRFAITLRAPGTVDLGYALLEPGEWGQFKGLPVRKDVAEAMIDQGITLVRYGGSMVNHAEYRWKTMIGPREQRRPHRNTWYPYSTNGWAIPDFMNFSDAAGFEAIPAFNMDESPQDMVDFIQYAKGATDTEWGARRAKDGHLKPYQLRYLQLGNEEKVDEAYFKKFKPLAEAIWKADPDITLVVGDFDYRERIKDPFKFGGTSSGITSLAAHQKILKLAKAHGREVWFDVHVWTDGPRPDATLPATFSFIDALEKLADGAKFKVAVFELNANSHGMRRALANAIAVQAIERDGRIAVVASANALQPDGQNDNGWDQGLLFLNPSQVWLQPPGYVTQMFSRAHQPRFIPCQVNDPKNFLDVTAKLSKDGKTLVLQVVNPTNETVLTGVALAGFTPGKETARVTVLSGPLTATNTADRPKAVTPKESHWSHGLPSGKASYSFPPYSVTVISIE